MDILDILSLGEESPQSLPIAQEIYKLKYSDKFIWIDVSYRDPVYIKSEFINDPESIIFRKIGTAGRFLRLFGHLISKIGITESKNIIDDNVPIAETISLYCSETLKELQFSEMVYSDIFKDFEKPFKNLEYLSLWGHFEIVSSEKFNFGELFPAVKTLSLKDVKLDDKIGFVSKLQHLEHLSVTLKLNEHLDDTFGFLDDNDIMELIKMNPHIHHLTLSSCNRAMLQFVSENMPQLKTLELGEYDESNSDDQREINFNNLKSFKMLEFIKGDLLRNIQFENLEELEIRNEKSDKTWIDAVAQNFHLKKLHIKEPALNNEDLNELARIIAPRDITELTAKVNITLPSDTILRTIINFVNGQPQTLKYTWYVVQDSPSIMIVLDYLQQELGHSCEIENIYDRFVLTRKSMSKKNLPNN